MVEYVGSGGGGAVPRFAGLQTVAASDRSIDLLGGVRVGSWEARTPASHARDAGPASENHDTHYTDSGSHGG